MPYHLAMGQYIFILSQIEWKFKILDERLYFCYDTNEWREKVKRNYQKELDQIIENLNGTRKTLLLQVCCAPCSSYCIEYLSRYFDITLLYYNPNISPVEEYEKRLEEVKRFIQEFDPARNVTLLSCDYDGEKYENMVKGFEQEPEGGSRCYKCYELRLKETARLAKENHFDYFGTTLSISPYKNANWLNEIGEALGKKYDISYLYADFKKKNGYKRSIELSREFDLYRQDYCGCIYSKKARDERVLN